MGDIPIFLCYYATFGGLIFGGVSMLIGSDASLGLLYRIFRNGEFPKASRNLSWSEWPRLKCRLAGLMLTGVGIYMAVLPIVKFLNPTQKEGLPPGESLVQGKWVLFGLLATLFVLGIYLGFNPRFIGSARHGRESNASVRGDARHGLLAVRLIGICLAAIAAYFVFVLQTH